MLIYWIYLYFINTWAASFSPISPLRLFSHVHISLTLNSLSYFQIFIGFIFLRLLCSCYFSTSLFSSKPQLVQISCFKIHDLFVIIHLFACFILFYFILCFCVHSKSHKYNLIYLNDDTKPISLVNASRHPLEHVRSNWGHALKENDLPESTTYPYVLA